MWSEHEELNQVKRDLMEGKTATPVTIRKFLSWFGAQRRTVLNVQYINGELVKVGVHTIPDYLNIWVDTPITFELDKFDDAGKQIDKEVEVEVDKEDPHFEADDMSLKSSSERLSYKIGKLAAANNAPVSVKPNATLKEAITIMIARNLSQLPIMTNERDVKGVVSWASIGTRLIAGKEGVDVQFYMDEHHEVSASSSLFDGIKIIIEHNYVLVRSTDRKITGIVTSNDISEQFEEISTPFLLIGDIENNLRHLIGLKLNLENMKQACGENNLPSDFSGVSDLNFGHYIRILSNEANWYKVGLHLDRSAFCEELSDVNRIRNDVMHFDPDPLTVQDLSKLRNVAKMFDVLKIMHAI